VGIGIQKTNAGIGIPAFIITVRYRSYTMPDCVVSFRYRTVSGIVSFFQSGTGLIGCRTAAFRQFRFVFFAKVFANFRFSFLNKQMFKMSSN
jgi:hypothetical protein